MASSDPSTRFFAALAAHHGEVWAPAQSPKFGANALHVHGKIFAALTRNGRLLLKLPPARIAEVLAAGRGERFASGGRVMNGWVTLAPDDKAEWLALSDEARVHVAGELELKRKRSKA